MDVHKLLGRVETDDHLSFNERDAKQLLKSYGVPVVREMATSDIETTLAAAEELGYPVVIKGFGMALQHKTERGLVHLNLCDARSVKMAVESIMAEAGQELEGFLVQTCLTGKREFVAGMFRDDLFGPVVMFGLGGIFTEAIHDVTFRLAPLNPGDAQEMLNGIQAQAMLGNFRGEAGVDRSSIESILMGLSRLAMDEPDIAEIDINPLIADAKGRVTAVDALVCFRKQKRALDRPCPWITVVSIDSFILNPLPLSVHLQNLASGGTCFRSAACPGITREKFIWSIPVKEPCLTKNVIQALGIFQARLIWRLLPFLPPGCWI